MKIAVIGPGAMGLLFGARLAQSGNEVYMIGSTPATIDKLNREGIQLEYAGEASRVKVSAALAQDMAEKVELAILFTKTIYSKAALDACAAYVGEDTWLMTLQNGLGNVELMENYVPKERLIVGVTNYGSDLIAPGHVVSSGKGYLKMSAADGREHAMVARVNATLQAAGFASELVPDTMTAIWEKVAFNAAINAAAAVCHVPCGGMGKREESAGLCYLIAEETCRVAEAWGVPADAAAVKEMLRKTIFEQHQEHYPSMAQDVMKKRPTEVEFINGAIWRKAQEIGMQAPYNETMYRLLLTLEANY